MNNKIVSSSTSPTRKRYGILGLVFISVVINYLDRSNISVAASALSEELDLDKVKMGLIFSAFGWTYASLQIPGGVIVDKIRARLLYAIILTLWSIATLLQGLISSFAGLIGLRASIGIFEAPSFPINNAIATKWFPEEERASAIAFYTSGQYIGLAFLTPLLAYIQGELGWRGLFVLSGIVGLVWAVVWYLFYRDPENHTKINQEELDHIQKGEAKVKIKPKPFQWKDLKHAFIYKKLWGLYLGQFCLGSTFIFFLTWFPTYLQEQKGIDLMKSGIMGSVPFLGAFLGVIISGLLSDKLIKSGVSKEIARKAPVLAGLLLSSSIIFANYTTSPQITIMFLTLAFFGTGFASIAWIFVSAIAPKEHIGLIGGVFNLMGGLSAVIVPIAIGILAKDGNFEPALFFIGIIAIIGFLAYIFLVGKVERIEIPTNE
ncbi:MFS transporter [Aquimarina sp. RZ0]|uniref:MFS transporter n=1 Tax=Aquimarina sp. RZ0 TaxID=2607730 RepID=UPI0011F2E17A|nr:MFS transporter [Aquimarina sp. RZ0]KAA1247861.1 MFS transporter [Aquimarina sp. RZ0]